jgi:RimJ/RimL family protein N-acetyltransferase
MPRFCYNLMEPLSFAHSAPEISPMAASLPSLDTERVSLRRFARDDCEIYAARIFGDARVTRYLPASRYSPSERAALTIQRFEEHWAQHNYGPFALTHKTTGEFVGHCGLRLVPELGEIELLYALAYSFWNQGLATEAARACVQWGMEALRFERLVALAVPENIASRRVMEHVGFTVEKEMDLFGMHVIAYGLDRANYKGVTD